MDELAKLNEIRRLHAVCREKNHIIKELLIACRQAIITLKNQQPLPSDLSQEWERAISDGYEAIGTYDPAKDAVGIDALKKPRKTKNRGAK